MVVFHSRLTPHLHRELFMFGLSFVTLSQLLLVIAVGVAVFLGPWYILVFIIFVMAGS